MFKLFLFIAAMVLAVIAIISSGAYAILINILACIAWVMFLYRIVRN